MQSSLISKIEKARIYAEQPERFNVLSLRIEVRGDSSTHTAEFGPDGWTCDCFFFHDAGTCSHTMALERMLDQMLPEAYRPAFSIAT
ncbi:MAG: hypothetical protein OXH13_12700 [Chloroflexi bacterium]|nr:hypothetical protein [Chloroflexota bacterium]MCY3695795.1 hypothetical protein [Chloroflexota bacterium]